jgi:acetylglutamate kinase
MTLLITTPAGPQIEQHLQRNNRVISFKDGSRKTLWVTLDTAAAISHAIAADAEELDLPLSLSMGPHR